VSEAAPETKRFIDSHKGWQAVTHTLANGMPYWLTQGGNSRKALYTLMRSRKK
jgi:hypothetical protein